ncbi:hypothetical protein [Wenzhouxiangella sp. XN79A]|uniref:hypothetical protein n=1 Tax=Wenzhouxiangella sp. XN79A TaxID=2724193 RepID=UPI00197D6E29|nr:hypothetical protein [Wenzhouxiangella sp. XN79A]
MLQFLLPLVASGAAVAYAAYAVGAWSAVQYLLCAVLAFDIVGGIITNATSSGKRWYHRPGQGVRQHFGFVLVHLAHLAVVAWLFLSADWPWLATTGSFLLVAALAILVSPLYLQRPVAMAMYTGSVVLGLYVLASPPGMEWFLPLFYLKLLVAHLPRETAYRPHRETGSGIDGAGRALSGGRSVRAEDHQTR